VGQARSNCFCGTTESSREARSLSGFCLWQKLRQVSVVMSLVRGERGRSPRAPQPSGGCTKGAARERLAGTRTRWNYLGAHGQGLLALERQCLKKDRCPTNPEAARQIGPHLRDGRQAPGTLNELTAPDWPGSPRSSCRRAASKALGSVSHVQATGTPRAWSGGLSRTAGHSLSGGGDGSLRRETGEEGGHKPKLGRWPPNLVLVHGSGCGGACEAGCPRAVA